MRIIEGLAALDRTDLRAQHGDSIDSRSAVLVGVFDGVHLGHQRLLHELLELASELESAPSVVTFRNHPDELLRGRPAEWIVSLPHRLRLLRRAGVTRVALLDFDPELRNLTAEEFTTRVLVRGLRTEGLLLGYDSAIGRDREGTPGRMRELGERHGFLVHEGSLFTVDGRPISSTAIRAAIAGGDLDLCHRMLGRWPAVFGPVVQGAARGRVLGFPTANVLPQSTVLPPPGVYAVEVLHGGETFRGVANLGTRPTFAPAGGARGAPARAAAGTPPATPPATPTPTLEVHLLDFDGDLYGAMLEVGFAARLRDERRFADAAELQAQIAADIAEARTALSS